jgi:hypothetical protein
LVGKYLNLECFDFSQVEMKKNPLVDFGSNVIFEVKPCIDGDNCVELEEI